MKSYLQLRFAALCSILSLVILLDSGSAKASTDYVDASWAELNDAINSGSADTIRFNFRGTIDFSTMSASIPVPRPVVIYSDAPGNVVFDGGGGAHSAFRTFPGNGSLVEIHGVTFQFFAGSAVEQVDGQLLVNDCHFEGNQNVEGGAISNGGSLERLTATRCSFFQNMASSGGGGAIYGPDDMLVENCTFHQNGAPSGEGGAIYVFMGVGFTPKFSFNTLISNNAMISAGGIFCDADADVNNNLFLSNTAGSSEDAFFSLPTISDGWNYFLNSGRTNMTTIPTDVLSTPVAGHIRANFVHDGYGHRYFPIINEFSPLVDAGGPASTPALDQRGAPREMHGNSGAGFAADIGAVEFTRYRVVDNDGATTTFGSLGYWLEELATSPNVGPPYFISFDLPSGLEQIAVATPMPDLQVRVIIDGFTQHQSEVPGWKDIAGGQPLYPGIPGVQITDGGGVTTGLTIQSTAGGSELKGLSITDFASEGILLNSVSGVAITGCMIGIERDGITPRGNNVGIRLVDAMACLIGGDQVIERNVISANQFGAESTGVMLDGTTSSFLHYNLIGTDPTGANAMGNLTGVLLKGATSSNQIGVFIQDRTTFHGTEYFGVANVISGNSNGSSGQGIFLQGTGVTGNIVVGNYIGLAADGSALASSNYAGISIGGLSQGNSIGGQGIQYRNVISSNQTSGIHFSTTAGDHVVEGNWIGLTGTGTAAAANDVGIRIEDNTSGYSMVIGGTAAGAGNYISGNTTDGIQMNQTRGVATTNRLRIEGNFIGVGSDGLTGVSNGVGIVMDDAQFITIGSDACANCGNDIVGNTGAGVFASGTTDDVIMYNNNVGVTAGGDIIANGDGIRLDGSTSYFTIGGASVNQANHIAHNTGDGVQIIGATDGADLFANSIHNNGDLGVDILNDGFTVNDAGDSDSGPNRSQNYPVIVGAFECPGDGFTKIEYQTDFEIGFSYSIQFFIADSDNQEGETYLGEQIITPSVANEVFSYSHSGVIANGTNLVANASLINGSLYSTSEFSPSFTVAFPVLAVTPTDPTVCGSADGELSISASPSLVVSTAYDVTYTDDGSVVGPNSITTDASGDILLSALDSGTYQNIVIDINGCQIADAGPYTLSYPAVPNPVMSGPATVCQDSTENYTVTGNGGTFTWSIVGGTLDVSTGTSVNATWGPPSAAFIDVTETIGSCTELDQIIVSIDPSENPSFSLSSTSECQSGTDITATVTGDVGGTFSASPGITVNATSGEVDVSSAAPGAYNVIYTTGGPCPASDTVVVTILPDEDAGYSLSTLSACESDADITATITGTGGGAFSSVPVGLAFNSSTGLIDVSSSAPGTYSYTYSTPGACSADSTLTVNVLADDDPSFSYSASTYCENESDPVPTITGTGGGTFSITGGGTINAATGAIDLSASGTGSYTVTYTTPGVCPQSSNVAITITSAPTVNAGPDQSVCANTPVASLNGSVAVALGGSWTTTGTGTFTPDNITLNADYNGSGADVSGGSVTLTLTSTGNGTCLAVSDNVVITFTPAPTFSVSAIDPTQCGLSDGQLQFDGLLGSTNYDFGYMLDGSPVGPINGTTTPGGSFVISGLPEGTYTSVMADLGGCVGTDAGTYTLSEPAPPVVDAGADRSECEGVLFTIGGTPTATGGSGSYSYVWDNGAAPTSNPSVSVTGNTEFTVTVTDAVTNCVAEDSVIITAVATPLPVITGNSTVCEGSNQVYTVSSFPSITWTLSTLNGTTGTGSTTITETLSMGTSTGVNDSVFVSVTNASGCTGMDTMLVTIVNNPTYSVSVTNPTTCGGTDGELLISGLQASTFFDVMYDDDNVQVGPTSMGSDGAGDLVLSGLDAGIYDSIFIAVLGCGNFDNASYTISDPSPPVIDSINLFNPTSCGGTDGSVVIYLGAGSAGGAYGIDVDGGGDDFTLAPSGGIITITGLSAGFSITSLTLTHLGTNCAVSDPFTGTLSDPVGPTTAMGSIDESCAGYSDGEIGTQPTGGTSPYTSNWYSDNTLMTSVPGSPADTITNVAPGWYYVEIIDGAACSHVDSVEVGTGTVVNVGTDVLVNDSCVLVNSFDFNDATISATSNSWQFMGGTPATASTNTVTGVNFNGTGTFTVIHTVVTVAGCAANDTVYVNVYDSTTAVINTVSPSCVGSADGGIDATLSGGIAPYSSDIGGVISTGTTPSWTGIPAGAYTILTTNGYGCNSTFFATITDPAPLDFDTTIIHATCGLNNGQVEAISASGGTSPYSYSFDGSTFTATTVYTGIGPGSYDLIMQDQNGCKDTIVAVVNSSGTLPPTPVLDGPYSYCTGDVFGPATASGGGAGATYNWYFNDTMGTPFATSATNSVVMPTPPAGTSTLYVTQTDATGCVSYAGAASVEYWPADYSISSAFTVCPGGTVQFDGLAGVGNFVWDNSAGELSNALVADPVASPVVDSSTYFFVYTNNSCSYPGNVLVYEDTLGCNRLNEISNAFSPNGDNVNDFWEINGIENTPNNVVTIFNRWGDEIVKINGYNNADIFWDGTGKNGVSLPAGTYFYMIQILDTELSQSGWVQLTK